MKRIILFAALCLAFVFPGRSQTFSDETLKYKVQYRWGLVSKVAGYVSISLRNTPSSYKATLTATSAPWADHLFKVRDTLLCEISKPGFKPVEYQKIAHEGGSWGHDVVRYSYSGNVVTGHCTRKGGKDGKITKDEERVLEAEGLTLDMFSAFYYMRSLPFDKWKGGEKTVLTVFSGKKKETLTIVYHGLKDVKYDKKKRTCHYITFRFTSDDGKKSSDDMDAYITNDSRRVPVLLVGSLPVGKVKCYLTE